MAPRFSRPRLTSADDKQYRAFLAQIMIGKDNQRAIRPPRARDLFGGEAEAALRGWLAQGSTLSERRIVEYLEHRGRSAIKKYRELDAVVIPDAKTIHVFEIKASQKATSLRRLPAHAWRRRPSRRRRRFSAGSRFAAGARCPPARSRLAKRSRWC